MKSNVLPPLLSPYPLTCVFPQGAQVLQPRIEHILPLRDTEILADDFLDLDFDTHPRTGCPPQPVDILVVRHATEEDDSTGNYTNSCPLHPLCILTNTSRMILL